MARAHPTVLQRVVQDGHSIGTHSQTHPLIFPKLTQEAGLQEIQKGFASTDAALAPIGDKSKLAPFFRIPGPDDAPRFYGSLSGSQQGISGLERRLPVADDWMPRLKPQRSDLATLCDPAHRGASGKGILLLHDIQPSTAVMLPTLLKELKARGFKVVHVEPATTTPVALSPGKPAAPATAAAQPASAPAVTPGAMPAATAAPAATTVAASPAKPAVVPRPVPAPQPAPLPQPAAAQVPEAEPAQKNPVETFFNQLWPRILPDLAPKADGSSTTPQQ